jgi:hypothetical protein
VLRTPGSSRGPQTQAVEALQRLGKFANPERYMREAVACQHPLGYRNKVTFSCNTDVESLTKQRRSELADQPVIGESSSRFCKPPCRGDCSWLANGLWMTALHQVHCVISLDMMGPVSGVPGGGMNTSGRGPKKLSFMNFCPRWRLILQLLPAIAAHKCLHSSHLGANTYQYHDSSWKWGCGGG